MINKSFFFLFPTNRIQYRPQRNPSQAPVHTLDSSAVQHRRKIQTDDERAPAKVDLRNQLCNDNMRSCLWQRGRTFLSQRNYGGKQNETWQTRFMYTLILGEGRVPAVWFFFCCKMDVTANGNPKGAGPTFLQVLKIKLKCRNGPELLAGGHWVRRRVHNVPLFI